MALTPGEADHLLLFTQAQLAQQRRDRGLRLNVPEATAIIAHQICEWARDGMDLDTARARARTILGIADVLPEVPSIVTQIRVEARFDDGTRLVVVTHPFDPDAHPADPQSTGPIATARLTLHNLATTDIGITSHQHLAEINPRVRLDRTRAFGMRLALPTGDTLWLEAGTTTETGIVPIGGDRVVIGNTGLIDGPLDDPAVRERALERLRECGYLDESAGVTHGDIDDAEGAVARVMAELRIPRAATE